MKIEQRVVDAVLLQNMLAGGCDPLIARLYSARAVTSEQEVGIQLNQLHHFETLKNIALVSNRLAEAILQQQNIIISADYDADGATACTIAIKCIKAMGGKVDFVVPDRVTEGYGLSDCIVDRARQMGADLIVTVDNGISSVTSIEYAQSLGIDVIVTDHHLPGEVIPNCLIVNPNQEGCTFPSKNIAGVGVIFYVMLALRSHLEQLGYFTQFDKPNLSQYLDIVALGTVADLVKLDHINRIFVSHGMQLIRTGQACLGIKALFEVAKKSMTDAKTFDLGFAIAPRINAAGRLDDMSISIRCLLSDDYQQALYYAEQLDNLNKQRKNTEKKMLSISESMLAVEVVESQYSIVTFSEQFHQGVIGIVAGRLKEKYYRPSIVFAKGNDGELKGSARSILGFHLRDALDILNKSYPGLILKFGGHAMAAGLSIACNRLQDFKLAFEKIAQQLLDDSLLSKTYLTDGSLDNMELTLQNAQMLNQMVWGQGFDEPSFTDNFEVVRQSFIGKDQSHSKLILKKETQFYEAMLFRCQDSLPRKVKLVYKIIANKWSNKEELQLYVDYWEAV